MAVKLAILIPLTRPFLPFEFNMWAIIFVKPYIFKQRSYAIVYLCLMIQRPQTLFFLAMVAICMMLLFSDSVFYKLSSGENEVAVEYDETNLSAPDGVSKEKNTWIISFLSGISIIAGFTLIMFKNRKLQILLSSFNFLFILGLIVMMYAYSIGMNYFEGAQGGITFLALMPIALLLFNFLAIRGVKKDVQLIRSTDRLR